MVCIIILYHPSSSMFEDMKNNNTYIHTTQDLILQTEPYLYTYMHVDLEYMFIIIVTFSQVCTLYLASSTINIFMSL